MAIGTSGSSNGGRAPEASTWKLLTMSVNNGRITHHRRDHINHHGYDRFLGDQASPPARHRHMECSFR